MRRGILYGLGKEGLKERQWSFVLIRPLRTDGTSITSESRPYSSIRHYMSPLVHLGRINHALPQRFPSTTCLVSL